MVLHFFINLVLSAVLISACSLLAQKSPRLAGFIVSLPLTTMLVLAFTSFQDKGGQKAVLLAKSIFLGVPLSLTFFIPFLLADRFRLTFWQAYGMGIFFIGGTYFVHRALFSSIQ